MGLNKKESAAVAEWNPIVKSLSVIVAFGVSVCVGAPMGIYPAMKAAPIDSMKPCVTNKLLYPNNAAMRSASFGTTVGAFA